MPCISACTKALAVECHARVEHGLEDNDKHSLLNVSRQIDTLMRRHQEAMHALSRVQEQRSKAEALPI
jgi:hypothetical protein